MGSTPSVGSNLPLEGPEIWLRVRGESGPAYRAFEAFRDAGAARSLAQTARHLGRDYRMVKLWASRHRWSERVLAWDREVGRRTAARRAQDVERVRRRQLAVADRYWDKLAARLARMNPDELSVDQLGKWLDILSRVERLATDGGAQAGGVVAVGVEVRTESDRPLTSELAAHLQHHPERIPVILPVIEEALARGVDRMPEAQARVAIERLYEERRAGRS